MQVFHTLVIDCSMMTETECSDLCVEALGHGLGFRLKCDKPDDTVHGGVTILHCPPPTPHEFMVEVYEADAAPTARMERGRMVGRESTLKRPLVMPTEQAIRDRLALRTKKPLLLIPPEQAVQDPAIPPRGERVFRPRVPL